MKKILSLSLVSAILLYALSSDAQVVSGNGFFKGTFVEAGIQPSGAFGSKVSAPSDYTSATVSKYSGRVGFIADVGKDGWNVGTPKYIGDFFVPGTPYEAFSVKMNGVLYENSGSGSTAAIPGAVIGYSSDGSVAAIEWLGSLNGLQVRQVTSVGKNSSYILIRATLKNTGSSTINNIFYTRSVDPDNEVDQGGEYRTINKIEDQNPNSTSTALVSGKGLLYGSYLGLGSRDCRARVAIMSSFSSDGESIFNGNGAVALSAKNATNTADNAIAVTFKVGNLAPGDSTTVSMAYVLNAADLPPAMDETDPLFNVKADTYGSGSIINVCSGSAATLNIINGDGYTWTWSPATGLDQTTGRSVKATLTGNITYTASGLNSCGTTRNITLSLHPVIAASPDAAGTISGPATIYQGWNATYTVPAIANATNYKWTIPAGASFISGYGTNTIVVKFGTGATSGNVSVIGENSCGAGASSTMAVNLSGGSALSISSDNNGVPGSSVFTSATPVDDKIKITGTETIVNPRVYIDAGFQTGDILSFTGTLPTGVTADYNPATGSLSFTGSATPAQWQVVFSEIKFHTTSVNTSDRTIKYVLGDMVSLMIGGKPHFYEYIKPSSNPSWNDAYNAAAGRTFFGLAGYLATITSSAENDFIKAKLLSDGWVGGSDYYQLINDVKGTTHANQSATEGQWFWVTGPEAGTPISTGNNSPVAVSGAFMNWATGEPNNAGNEHYMQLYSTQNGKWNDLAGNSSASVPGYVVEYGGYSSDPSVNIYYSRTIKSKPAAPVIISITDDTGESTNDFITSDRTIKLNGTAIANSTVKITRTGTGVIGTVTANASGNWTYDYTGTTLPEGTHNFTATATVGSVVSNDSDPVKVKIDFTAPSKPAKPALDGSVENYTIEEKPVFTGTAEAGSKVNLYSGTDLIGTAVADETGKWTITSTNVLAETSHVITAKATDTAGNTSVASDVFALTVDRTAPVKPDAPTMKDGDGKHTNNNKPEITGNTEGDAWVNIYKDGVLITTVKSDVSGYWIYTFTEELADGEYSITTSSKDGVGNTGELSDELIIVIDTQDPLKPGTPVLTGGNDGIINSAAPTITGVAEPNTTIEIFANGNPAGTATTDGSGNWSYTFSPALDDNAYEITVTSKDASGNTSEQSDVCSITVDTQKPVASAAPSLDTENSSGIVKISDPVISGNAEPNAKVYIYDGSSLIATLTADGSGNWSYHFSPTLSEGDHEISVRTEDAAGNVSDAGEILTITVDTLAPAVPSAPLLTGGNDGNINTSTPSLSGSAEPNSTVTIYKNGTPVGTVTANGSGNWSYTFSPALADGEYDITVTATDAAGNTSEASSGLNINVDTHAPLQPSISELVDGNNGYSVTNMPVINGNAEPGSTVKVYDNGNLIGTAITGNDGKWSYTFNTPLNDGEYHITITATDIADNTSPASESFSFTVDTEKPVTPSSPVLTTDNNNGIVNTNTPSLEGNAEPNSTITIYDGTTVIATITVDPYGKWSYTFDPSLEDGDHFISVTSTDIAGNTSDVSGEIKISVDTQKPLKPSTAKLEGSTNESINTSTPSISGEAEPGSLVTIYSNGVPVATVTADVNGKWNYTFDPSLEDGEYRITTTATDPAGNTSELSSSVSVKVDTQKPGAPSDNNLKDGINGRINTGKPTIDGKAEPGSTITIYNNGVPVGTTVTDANGKWTYTFTTELQDGVYHISTTSTDVAGNTSDISDELAFIVDTKKPAVPSVPEMKEKNNNGHTNINKPTINGKAEPGSTITIYDNGVPLGTVTVDENGNWSYNFDPELKDGAHSIQTTTTDSAGNVSQTSTPYVLSVDTRSPKVSVSSKENNAKGPFTVTFTFDEPVDGFSPESVILTNATGSNFIKVSDTEYTMLITPVADKDVTVQLAALSASDKGGNGNIISNLLTMKTTFSGIVKEVFPNPASNVLNVRFSGVVPEKSRVMIVKMSGQVVLDQQVGFQSNVMKIDVNRFSSGVILW